MSIAAVREAIGLVLEEYPGLRTVGRWTMWGAVAVSTLASVVVVGTYWRGPVVRTNLYYIEVATQCLVFGLAVVVASLLIFMSHYPLQLSRNRLVSSIAFGTIVLAEALTLFVDSTAERLNVPAVDMTLVVFSTICVAAWGTMLGPQEVVVKPKHSPTENDARLLQQLASIERALGRVGRSRA